MKPSGACLASAPSIRGMTTSVSRTGNGYARRRWKAFGGTLKNERVHYERYATHEWVRREITEYTEIFYHRRHSRLGNLSLAAFAQQWARQ